MKEKLRCFIAMSFIDEESEKVYLKSIKPILRVANIIPRCLIHIEHNDELNSKIIEEIKLADFVIADLSFARPSVYYEAGYAERIIPVIYTSRSDHFKAQEKDVRGNYRIHFDLQMKNIVKWKSADDKSFQKRLLKRINYVTLPLKKKLLTQSIDNTRTKEFSILSLKEKIKNLTLVSSRFLSKLSFKIDKTMPQSLYIVGSKQDATYLEASKRKENDSTVATIYIFSKLNKSILKEAIKHYYNHRVKFWVENGYADASGKKILLKEKLFLCCLNKFSLSMIRDEFPEAYLGRFSNSIGYTTTDGSKYLRKVPNTTRRFELFLIHSVDNSEMFIEELRKRVDDKVYSSTV